MCQMKSKDCSGNVTVFLLKEADGVGVPWPLPSGSSAWTWNTASNSSIYFAIVEYIQKNPSDTSPATIKWLQQHQRVCASRLTVTWEKIHFFLSYFLHLLCEYFQLKVLIEIVFNILICIQNVWKLYSVKWVIINH